MRLKVCNCLLDIHITCLWAYYRFHSKRICHLGRHTTAQKGRWSCWRVLHAFLHQRWSELPCGRAVTCHHFLTNCKWSNPSLTPPPATRLYTHTHTQDKSSLYDASKHKSSLYFVKSFVIVSVRNRCILRCKARARTDEISVPSSAGCDWNRNTVQSLV